MWFCSHRRNVPVYGTCAYGTYNSIPAFKRVVTEYYVRIYILTYENNMFRNRNWISAIISVTIFASNKILCVTLLFNGIDVVLTTILSQTTILYTYCFSFDQSNGTNISKHRIAQKRRIVRTTADYTVQIQCNENDAARQIDRLVYIHSLWFQFVFTFGRQR